MIPGSGVLCILGHEGRKRPRVPQRAQPISIRKGAVRRFCFGQLRSTGEKTNAHSQPANPQSAQAAGEAEQSTGDAGLPAEARRVHARLYDDPEEAELGPS